MIDKGIVDIDIEIDFSERISWKSFTSILQLIILDYKLGKPSKKINTIFYDIESISFATYPPYLIMT